MKPFILSGLMLALALCGGYAGSAEHDRKTNGDHLEMPATSTAATVVPTRGVDMARVEQRWGEPQTRLTAVGEPPITRWIYSEFTVYFEHNLVIHSVMHGARSDGSS